MTIFVEENVIQNSMELDDDFANDFLEQLKPLKGMDGDFFLHL